MTSPLVPRFADPGAGPTVGKPRRLLALSAWLTPIRVPWRVRAVWLPRSRPCQPAA